MTRRDAENFGVNEKMKRNAPWVKSLSSTLRQSRSCRKYVDGGKYDRMRSRMKEREREGPKFLRSELTPHHCQHACHMSARAKRELPTLREIGAEAAEETSTPPK